MNKLKTNIKNDIDYSNCWKNPASNYMTHLANLVISRLEKNGLLKNDHNSIRKAVSIFIDCIQETNIADAESKRSNKLCK